MRPVDHLVRPRGVHKERVRREDVLDGRRDTHYVLATIAANGSPAHFESRRGMFKNQSRNRNLNRTHEEIGRAQQS